VMNMVVDNCVRAKMCGGVGVRSLCLCEDGVGADEKCVAGDGCDEHGG